MAAEFAAYVYEVQVHYGRELPKMDVASDIDPYVMVEFPGGHTARTRTFDNNANPTWDSPVDLLVGEAPADWVLKVQLWDHDKGTSDDHVCDIVLPRDQLPVTRREFPVCKKHAKANPASVLCLSVSCFCAPSCAAERLAALGDKVVHAVEPSGQDWHMPVPACGAFSLGLHYTTAGNSTLYIAQTDPATLMGAFARFVATGDSAVRAPAENNVLSHFLVGDAEAVSAADPTRLDVLRRVGGPKGLRVFGEAQLLAPGSVPFDQLAVRVAKKRTLLGTFRLSDIAHDAAWSRITTKYADAKASVRNCVLDDENELVYFDADPRFTVSVTCSFNTSTVTAYLKAGNPGLYLDMIHSSANERIVTEYAQPVPLAGGRIQAASKITIADPPNYMRFEQVYLMLYREEEVVDTPIQDIMPLASARS